MLYFDRIDTSEGIGINEESASKEHEICNYWYLLDEGFNFQPYVFNGCHDVLMTSMNLSNIAIVNIKGVVYSTVLSTDLKQK